MHFSQHNEASVEGIYDMKKCRRRLPSGVLVLIQSIFDACFSGSFGGILGQRGIQAVTVTATVAVAASSASETELRIR